LLQHPGPRPHRPIAPVTLLTLSNSLPNLQNPSAPAGSQETQTPSADPQGPGEVSGSQANPNPSTSQQTVMQNAHKPAAAQQTGAAKLDRVQPDPEATLSRPWPNPPGLSPVQQTNPGNQAHELKANSETLKVLLWVHPAAAKEAWDTLKEFADREGVACQSRSVSLRLKMINKTHPWLRLTANQNCVSITVTMLRVLDALHRLAF